MRRFLKWSWALVGWTLFLWLSRLRNVLANDELTATGRTVRIGIVVLFVLLALAVVIGERRKQQGPLIVLVIWSIGYWLVRGLGILLDGEYSVGFKVVHTVLMVVSVTLAALTARQLAAAR